MRLLPSWHYEVSTSVVGAVELVAPLLRKRLLVTGPAVAQVLKVLDALGAGVVCENPEMYLSEISGLSRSDIAAIVEGLDRENAIKRAPDIPERQEEDGLYDRQVRFFQAFETQTRDAAGLNRSLQERTVAVIGLGGYGTWLALLCARAGVERLVLFDDDRVELSNLSQQVLYGLSEVGQLKVSACEPMLRAHNPKISIEPHAHRVKKPADLVPHLSRVDFVFNSFGYVSSDEVMNSSLGAIALACLYGRRPCLIFGGSGIGPLTIPGVTPCYWCVLHDTEVSKVISASAWIRRKQFSPAFVPRIAATASLAAWEAFRFLAGVGGGAVQGGLVLLDTFEYNNSKVFAVKRHPGCPMCSGRLS